MIIMRMDKEILEILNHIVMMNDIEGLFIIEEKTEEKLSKVELMFKVEEFKGEIYEEIECIDYQPIKVSVLNILQGKDFDLNIERYYLSVANKIAEMETDEEVSMGEIEEFQRVFRNIEDNLHLINLYTTKYRLSMIHKDNVTNLTLS